MPGLTETPSIPHMNAPAVFDSLRVVGQSWTGAGVAVECGTWLGASLAALAGGLVQAGYNRYLHSFDIWRANADEVRKAANQGVTIEVGQDLATLMLANVTPIYQGIMAHKGRIDDARWPGEPIEIFVLDAAKRNPSFSRALRTFAPSFIPGKTMVCLLDYWFYKKADEASRHAFQVQERWVEACGDALEAMPGLDGGSARFFRCVGKVATDAC